MDNIKREDIQPIIEYLYQNEIVSDDGDMDKVEGYIDQLEQHVKTLTDKLIKSNKDYCPERIGYEVHYKYIHEHCNGLDCDKCTRDQIDKGLNKG